MTPALAIWGGRAVKLGFVAMTPSFALTHTAQGSASAGQGGSRCEVTVILPTRNRARQLESGLALALGQAGVEHEVVVVDDGSTDETPELLAGIDHPRLVVLRNDVPRGVAAARNRGIARARGRYLAFLDDDDLWAPSKLREELTLAERTGAVLVYCDYIVLDDADRPI